MDRYVALSALERFCLAAFAAIGADQATGMAATRAMLHGTRFGVDSHGVRLLPHYLMALEGGRLNRNPVPRRVGGFGAVEIWDADHAPGRAPLSDAGAQTSGSAASPLFIPAGLPALVPEIIPKPLPDPIRAMIEAQAHRGPDGSGI